MTFSEDRLWLSLKCNAFDRCLSLQLHKSRYSGAQRQWQLMLGFFSGAKLLGNIRLCLLSVPHLNYLNISQHDYTCRAERE